MFILTLVVLGEIVLFQFMAALANRSLMRQEISSLDAEVPQPLLNHAERTSKFRMAMGGVLIVVALVPVTGLVGTTLVGKLLMTAVSITSAFAFTLALAKDRRMMRLLAELYPGGSVRRASLERRSLSQWYHPALEALPIMVFVATALFLATAPGFLSATPDSHVVAGRTNVLVLFGLQSLFVLGALYHTVRKGADVGSLATHIPSLRKRPQVSLRLGEQLAGVQAKYFMFAKIAVAALLGAAVVEKILEATGRSGASFWGTTGWVIVGLLLVTFGFYLRRVGRLSRRMQQEMELANQNTASAG